jgi:hypothetical protein
MKREAQIAERVMRRVSRDNDYYAEVQRFIKVRQALEEVIGEWEQYWRHGTAPDPVLTDMLKVSSYLAKEARRLKQILDVNIATWSKE